MAARTRARTSSSSASEAVRADGERVPLGGRPGEGGRERGERRLGVGAHPGGDHGGTPLPGGPGRGRPFAGGALLAGLAAQRLGPAVQGPGAFLGGADGEPGLGLGLAGGGDLGAQPVARLGGRLLLHRRRLGLGQPLLEPGEGRPGLLQACPRRGPGPRRAARPPRPPNGRRHRARRARPPPPTATRSEACRAASAASTSAERARAASRAAASSSASAAARVDGGGQLGLRLVDPGPDHQVRRRLALAAHGPVGADEVAGRRSRRGRAGACRPAATAASRSGTRATRSSARASAGCSSAGASTTSSAQRAAVGQLGPAVARARAGARR